MVPKFEKFAFESFKKVCDKFLGKHRSEDYVQSVDDLLRNYYDMGCNMSVVEKRFKVKWNLCMLADYCWITKRRHDTLHKRVKRKNVV